MDVVYNSLSTSNRTDSFTLTYPKGNAIPNMQGYETNDGIGRTRYHLFVIKNKSQDYLDAMTALSLWTGKPEATASRPSSNYSPSYISPQAITVADATTWPTRGFWVVNKTANSGAGDLRYVDYRSGNTLYTKAILWGRLEFQNGSREITPGMTITTSSTSNTAVVDQVILTDGSWTTGDATGVLQIKKFVGNFYTSDNIMVDGVTHARPKSASVRGFRGCTATSWSTGHVLAPASDIDVGFELPIAGEYADPTNENTAPDGVTFGYYDSRESPLILEALLGGDSVGVWTRENILDGTQAREGVIGDLCLEWY